MYMHVNVEWFGDNDAAELLQFSSQNALKQSQQC